MRTGTRVIIVLFTLLGCVGCDQASKSMARNLLGDGQPRSLLHDAIRLQLTENSGAFLSLGASLSSELRFAIFTAAVGAMVTGLLITAVFARQLYPWRVVAVALVAAGGTGNLLDRLMNKGLVTDFLNVGIGSLRTGIFNVADMAILAGAMLLLLGYKGTVSKTGPERT